MKYGYLWTTWSRYYKNRNCTDFQYYQSSRYCLSLGKVLFVGTRSASVTHLDEEGRRICCFECSPLFIETIVYREVLSYGIRGPQVTLTQRTVRTLTFFSSYCLISPDRVSIGPWWSLGTRSQCVQCLDWDSQSKSGCFSPILVEGRYL